MKSLNADGGEGGEAVDALLVFPGAVFAHFGGALFAGPFVEDVALLFEVEEGDGVSCKEQFFKKGSYLFDSAWM